MLSNAFIEPLIKYARIKDSANITAIGNPVTIPVDLFCFDLKNKKKQILYVGRMDFENKRVNRIVEAWEGIADRHKDWELVLVGDGPHKSLLQEYVAQQHIDFGIQNLTAVAVVDHDDDETVVLHTDGRGVRQAASAGHKYGVGPVTAALSGGVCVHKSETSPFCRQERRNVFAQ